MVKTKEYREGKTTFLSADLDHYSDNDKQPSSSLPVFYNPRMTTNRDLSILFLDAFNKQYPVERFCEPLCGSGIRSLRYLNEGTGEYRGVLNDINPIASKLAEENLERLNLRERAQVFKEDAKLVLLSESQERRFEYVDIDPFGSPAPFINGAIQSLTSKNGLLALTATDMPVLCGVFPRVALRKYGGLSMKAPFLHEIAIRLLIGSTYTIAGMNDCAIRPLVSLSADHYVRIWVKVDAERKTTNQQAEKIGFIYYCQKCMKGWKQTLIKPDKPDECPNCGKKGKKAGPLWIGELFDTEFMRASNNLLDVNGYEFSKKTLKTLDFMIEEMELTNHLYVDIHKLCDLHNYRPPPTEDIMKELRDTGYAVARTHIQPTAIRTDAETEKVAELIKRVNRKRI
jgi:tRNA (guanine26-N2/guanine27-N2)-dimethyltransferase